MNLKKAREFLKELDILKKKYGFDIVADYQEEYEYNFDGDLELLNVETNLVLSDEEGLEIPFYKLENDYNDCYYCGRQLSVELSFCSNSCEVKFDTIRNKRKV